MFGDTDFRCSGNPIGAIIMDNAEHSTGQSLHGGANWCGEACGWSGTQIWDTI